MRCIYTIVHKYPEVKATLKYWVGPDLNNRIKNGSIRAVFSAETKQIRTDGLVVDTPEESNLFLQADKIFSLTGFTPNIHLLRKWGLKIKEDLSVAISDSFESNRNGVYIIGSAAYGLKTNSVFIENGREHAVLAVTNMTKRITTQ